VAEAFAANFAKRDFTPHLSQITPRCFIRLYFAAQHSQSVTGQKILAQKQAVALGLKVR